ncbi:TylF/MycF/NovP-related O-methyltransferase [Leptolyngbya sp. NIES-2104]|uniref:TylF/MycF/NovP-related O-methyltransferase n=1 Tax=Leptolyngbya sp. NIES-2104 TaxID=1552121 RepID=UPI0006EC7A80|nr:TylF/MycF/NovP-related O-methyltransferase [Leptolyngbya sp. NIES-2104]GAP96399.1 macrocin-O-methyltransferase domain protein [Leptolyngbya sp. NIES-2104]
MPLSSSLLEQVRPYTLCTPDRLENLAALCEDLNAQRIPGDFVECGTYKGGSAAILSKGLGERRHLWLYDSFQGLPPTTEKDGEDAKWWVGECVGAIADLKAVMQAVGTSETAYTIKPGWFETTLQQDLPEQIALLHCDADWYDSVMLVLETFYPRISPGGCIVLDDFGYWEGCREAFYDFCQRYGEKPVLERVGPDQAFWFKGRSHNRQAIPHIHGDQQVPKQMTAATIADLESKIEFLTDQLQQTQNELQFVKSSRFWWLRQQWWSLKQKTGQIK